MFNGVVGRRTQIMKYLSQHPEAKGRNVLSWIRKQVPDPWPDADNIKVKNMLRYLRGDLEPKRIDIRWDNNISADISISKWKRKQIQRYLQINPEAQAKQVKV